MFLKNNTNHSGSVFYLTFVTKEITQAFSLCTLHEWCTHELKNNLAVCLLRLWLLSQVLVSYCCCILQTPDGKTCVSHKHRFGSLDSLCILMPCLLSVLSLLSVKLLNWAKNVCTFFNISKRLISLFSSIFALQNSFTCA